MTFLDWVVLAVWPFNIGSFVYLTRAFGWKWAVKKNPALPFLIVGMPLSALPLPALPSAIGTLLIFIAAFMLVWTIFRDLNLFGYRYRVVSRAIVGALDGQLLCEAGGYRLRRNAERSAKSNNDVSVLWGTQHFWRFGVERIGRK